MKKYRHQVAALAALGAAAFAPESALASSLTQSFHYDDAGRLVAAEIEGRPELSEHYAYDASGNIARKTTHGETATMTYDSANQLVAKTGENGAVTEYEYAESAKSRR